MNTPPSKILLIDDDKLIIELIKSKLENEGYEVLTAYDGAEAFEFIDQQPDLIITDILMPHLSGLELLRILKNKMFSEIPVIVISQLEGDDTIYEALETGAVDFMGKPINTKELLIRVKMILSRIDSLKSS